MFCKWHNLMLTDPAEPASVQQTLVARSIAGLPVGLEDAQSRMEAGD